MSEKLDSDFNDESKLKDIPSANEEENIYTSKSDIDVSSPAVSTSLPASTVATSTSRTSVSAPIIVITSVSDASVSTPAALPSTTAVSISTPVDSDVTLGANADESSSTSGVDVSTDSTSTISTHAALPSTIEVSIFTPVDSAVTFSVKKEDTSKSDVGVTSVAVSTSTAAVSTLSATASTMAVSTSTSAVPTSTTVDSSVTLSVKEDTSKSDVTTTAVSTSTVSISMSTTSSTMAVSTSTSAVSTSVALPSSDAVSVLTPVVPALASSIAASMADFAESYPIIYGLLQNSLALSNPLVSNMLQSEDSWVDRLKNWNREYQKLEKLNMVRCLEGKKQDSKIELKEPGMSSPDEDDSLAQNPPDSSIKHPASKDLASETLPSEPCTVVADVFLVLTTNQSANNNSAQNDIASSVQENGNEEGNGGPRNTPESEVVLLLIPQFRYLLSTLSELEEFIDDQVKTGTAADAVARASSPCSTTTDKSGRGVEPEQSLASTDSVKDKVPESDSVAQPEKKESVGQNEAISGASSLCSTTKKSGPGVESAQSPASADSGKDVVPELESVAQPEKKESTATAAKDNRDAATPASTETSEERSEQKQGFRNPPEVLSILRRLDEEVQNRVIECSERAERIVSVCHEHGAETFREEIVSHMMGIMEGLNFHVRVRMELGRLLKLHLNIEETSGLTFIMQVNTQISEAYNRLLDDILTLNIIVLENIRSVPV